MNCDLIDSSPRWTQLLNYSITISSCSSIGDYDKINILLKPLKPRQVEKLGPFIKQSLELRSGDTQCHMTFDYFLVMIYTNTM